MSTPLADATMGRTDAKARRATGATMRLPMESSNEPHDRMNYVRVYSSPDGESHFEDLAMKMTPGVYVSGIPLVDSAQPQAASALTFSHVAAGYDSDWHHAPRRQYVLVLSGLAQVTVSDGEVRRFGPGSVILVEDTTGRGHQTRAAGVEDFAWAAVAV